MPLTRRHFLKTAAQSSIGILPVPPLLANAASQAPTLTLGFNTYGARSLSTKAAIDVIAKTGFDSIELSLMAGWDTDPATLTIQQERDLKKHLADSGLRLTALQEHLHGITDPDADPAPDLERIKRAFDLAHFLDPDRPPLLESALGGKLGWEETRELLLRRLPAWQTLAEKEKIVLAIKPHRGNGMTRPEHAIEVIRALGDSPWLRINFDYSHYAYTDPPLPLVATVENAAAHTALVTVKDTVLEDGDKARFRLPGEAGTIDYPLLLKTLFAGGYRGDVQCEVSAQLWKQPGYDPSDAMRICYRNMAAAFEKAGIHRPL